MAPRAPGAAAGPPRRRPATPAARRGRAGAPRGAWGAAGPGPGLKGGGAGSPRRGAGARAAGRGGGGAGPAGPKPPAPRRAKARRGGAAERRSVSEDVSDTVAAPGPSPADVERLERDVRGEPSGRGAAAQAGAVLGLGLLSLSYLHHSLTGFALPSLLPQIAADLGVADSEQALLTFGYTLVYALALIPVGRVSDKFDRSTLLAGGILVWSTTALLTGQAHSFQQLLLLRALFAVGQAVQNPVSFSIIPELFPENRTTAMSVYNSATYLGRALAAGGAYLAAALGVQGLAPEMVPMEDLGTVDLSMMQILYTTGDSVAMVPAFAYDLAEVGADNEAWRQILEGAAAPGFAIALLVFFLVREPDPCKATLKPAETLDECVVPEDEEDGGGGRIWDSPLFRLATLGATFQDLAFWSVAAWQASFYERVFNLTPDVYSPWLAFAIPVGGLVGGLGGGVLGDAIARRWPRRKNWFLVASSLAAAPCMAASALAPSFEQSVGFLAFGFGLSEMWRAPGTILVRESVREAQVSLGTAEHLFARNLVAGLGPLAIAKLEPLVGMRDAYLFIPAAFTLSGLTFLWITVTETGAEPPKKLV